MAQSIFENLSKVRTDTYVIGDGEKMDITIRTLSVGDIADIDLSDVNQKLELILKSVIGSHPDETIETIKDIPIYVAEPLTQNIFEFNGMTLPDDDD